MKRQGTNDIWNLLLLCKICHLEADRINHSGRWNKR
jgi:hypothetical protein